VWAGESISAPSLPPKRRGRHFSDAVRLSNGARGRRVLGDAPSACAPMACDDEGCV
jgi:hypothetical protein